MGAWTDFKVEKKKIKSIEGSPAAIRLFLQGLNNLPFKPIHGKLKQEGIKR